MKNFLRHSKITRFPYLLRWFAARRSIRLTSEGITFLLFTVGIGVAAINTGNNLFYLLLSMMLGLVIISGMLSELSLRRLGFHRHVPDLITANDPTTLTISMTNHNKHLPSFSLRLLDVIEGKDVDRGLYVNQLPGQRSVILSYPLLVPTRGIIRLGGVRVETSFPFGLFLKRVFFPAEADLLIGPPIKPFSLKFVDAILSEAHGQAIPRRGPGTDLYNLRTYQPGDDSRSIHWMSTARTSQLIVRETETEDQRRITVLFSTVAPEEQDGLFERSITLVASLIWHLCDKSHSVRLVIDRADSGFGTGTDHLLTTMKMLALCRRRDPHRPEADSTGQVPPLSLDPDRGYALAILPWSDPAMLRVAEGAHRVFVTAQLEELTHAF